MVVWAPEEYHECESQSQPPPTVLPGTLPEAAAVAAGHCSVYLLSTSGQIVAWGGSFLCTQTHLPWDDNNYTEVVGGYASAMVRRVDGTIAAFGAQDDPSCDPEGPCCFFKHNQASMPNALSEVIGLVLVKGNSNIAHFVIVPNSINSP